MTCLDNKGLASGTAKYELVDRNLSLLFLFLLANTYSSSLSSNPYSLGSISFLLKIKQYYHLISMFLYFLQYNTYFISLCPFSIHLITFS